jgi:hypothetical protein
MESYTFLNNEHTLPDPLGNTIGRFGIPRKRSKKGSFSGVVNGSCFFGVTPQNHPTTPITDLWFQAMPRISTICATGDHHPKYGLRLNNNVVNLQLGMVVDVFLGNQQQ